MFIFKKGPMLNRFTKKKSKLCSFGVIVALFLLILAVGYFALIPPVAVRVSTGEKPLNSSPFLEGFSKTMVLLDITESKMQTILSEGCPVITTNSQNINRDFFLDPVELAIKGLSYITDLNNGNPVTILKSQLAVLATVNTDLAVNVADNFVGLEDEGEEDFYLQTPPGLDEWHFEINESEPVELSKDPVVFIYNTHNAETYKPTDGKSKLEGQNAGIVKVAKVLAETLESKEGLKTIRSEVIHDYPDFARSYIKSLETAQKILKVNKTIRAVFDVHRDAGFKSKSTTTVTIKGKKAASIMIVVGTEHERWRSNLLFAEKLEAKANELYPGLIRDIRIRDNRRYNQHLHPNSLILEVGSDLNTLAEAQYSASLMATVIGQVIKETSL